MGYPAELESEVLLADGRVAQVRPIVPEDAEALRAFAGRLSAETVYLRFFSARRQLTDAELRHFTNVDYERRLAIVAFVDGELVAVARYERLGDGNEAEVAFTVRDDQQGRGLGTVLLEHLASAALTRGITTFVGDTLPENSKMLGVFREAGLVESARFDSGVIRVTIQLDPVPGYADKVEERDSAAAARSIARILEPSSVAVIGASPRPRTIGYALVANLLAGGFTGRIHPVHPTAPEVLGLPAYPSIAKVPEPVDLAVIAVPAASVPAVVEECGEAGCGGLVVVSAGFAETGRAGAEAERQIVSSARRHGMRLVGPNCMGVINTAEHVRLDATFAPVAPVPGRIAFCSQSGGLGVAILGEASRRGLGISSFVSVGNKADVSSNDLIRYWEQDPGTDVILLYLESFGNPRHFSRIARRVGRRRPIVAVKSGRSASGVRGTALHTAAAGEAPDDIVDALFRQAGVIRVDTLEELFDVAEVVHHQPLPAGDRVGILGNAGGPVVLAADACEARGLQVPVLSEATQGRLREVLGGQAAVRNPVDCNPSATPEEYGRALDILLDDPGIDAAITILTPPFPREAEGVATQVVRVAGAHGKPVVANFLATEGTVEAFRSGEPRIPWFHYPESAARALAKVVPYAVWRRECEAADEAEATTKPALASEPEPAPEPDPQSDAAGKAFGDPLAARAVLSAALEQDPGNPDGVELSADATSALLATYGIPLKAVEAPPPAPPLSVRLVEDPLFGPVVSVGLAGLASEVFGDRALRLAPFSQSEAESMVRSLRAVSVLEAAPAPADFPAIGRLLCRVARMAEDLPEIARLELEPVVSIAPGGVSVGGARVTARAVLPEPALRRRRLR
jgi:acetyl coenzyme A synthetase (ADP forming)-like protein